MGFDGKSPFGGDSEMREAVILMENKDTFKVLLEGYFGYELTDPYLAEVLREVARCLDLGC